MEARDSSELEHVARYAIEGDCARAQITGLNGGGGILTGGTRAEKRRKCTRTPQQLIRGASYMKS